VDNKTAEMEELIKKHSFDKSETVVIGDSNHEIEAGQSIGIRTVATTWGFTLEKRLIATYPDFIVHNLDELRAIWD
jgi:phosphoglycolate phosphatase